MISNKRYNILMVVLLMITGAIIYILFREPVIFTKRLMECYGHSPIITLPNTNWAYFILYYLPDILWCTALLCYASTIQYKPQRIIAVLLAPTFEICQLLDTIPGTFDILDLIFYITIIQLFLLKWTKPLKKRNWGHA